MTERGIPEELLNFFRGPGGHSLIVKGPAGTGKTTFALQLTEELGHLAHSYYMSVRVSDISLYNQFPWLKEKMERLETLRAERAAKEPQPDDEAPKRVATQAPPAQPTAGSKLDRGELRKLEGRIEMGMEGDDSYGKVGEGQMMENTVIFDLGSDLPEVDLAYDEVERNLPETTLVLIDSIDALSERYGVVASKLINTLQRDLVENGKANVVYVLESGTDSRLDYLGDGVLRFETTEHDGRRLRTMIMEKLRGTEILQHKYIYTLSHGKFRAFPVVTEVQPDTQKAWQTVPDLASGAVSSGMPDMDRLFGGFPRGTIVALEVSRNVPSFCVDNLKLALVANFAAQGRGVAYVPAQKATAEIVRDWIVPYIGTDGFDKTLRVFEASPLGSFEGSQSALRLEGQNVDMDLRWSALEHNLPNAEHPFLSFASFDTLEAVYGENVVDSMTGHLSSVRRSNDIFLGLVSDITKSTRALANLAHVHLRVEEVNGSILVFGQKPFTGVHVLDFDVKAGYPRVSLHPVA